MAAVAPALPMLGLGSSLVLEISAPEPLMGNSRQHKPRDAVTSSD